VAAEPPFTVAVFIKYEFVKQAELIEPPLPTTTV
jgi:hypothetical protein